MTSAADMIARFRSGEPMTRSERNRGQEPGRMWWQEDGENEGGRGDIGLRESVLSSGIMNSRDEFKRELLAHSMEDGEHAEDGFAASLDKYKLGKLGDYDELPPEHGVRWKPPDTKDTEDLYAQAGLGRNFGSRDSGGFGEPPPTDDSSAQGSPGVLDRMVRKAIH